jgi:hypothetical protein
VRVSWRTLAFLAWGVFLAVVLALAIRHAHTVEGRPSQPTPTGWGSIGA